METFMQPVVYDHREPEEITEEELQFFLKLDTWTLMQATFLRHGYMPRDDAFTYEELSTHFQEDYMLAVNSIKSGTLAREITIAGKRRYIASPAEWLKWAAAKELPICPSLESFRPTSELLTDKIQEKPREVRKQSTQERYKRWQDLVNESASQYRLKSHSDVCRMVAKGLEEDVHWQTIRRRTRKT